MTLLRIQQPAPSFSGTAVINKEFKKISLSDYRGKCCPTEIVAYSDRSAEFEQLGASLIGCSVDSEYSHLAWINTSRDNGGLGEMKIPILSDITKKISKDYGVLLEEEGVALRGTFIIDPKGILRQITINDLPIGRSIDETLRLLDAIQFTDEHGEVCPVNWKKGDKTMKENPTDSKSYFADTHK